MPDGQEGELLLRGPTISPGYHDSPEANMAAHTDDGWFRSGDILRRDGGGSFFFVDRARDMIRTGGLNVYAADVEQAIVTHAGDVIADVAVLGSPSHTWGEEVVAVVVARPGATVGIDTLAARLRGQIGDYKIPKRSLRIDALPRDTLGKIDKKQLRTLLAGDPGAHRQ